MTITRRVLFVCLHGSAKSVIAAHLLQRLADERGLALECASAGLDPDDAVPPHVIAGLRDDGVEPAAAPPERLTPELVKGAETIVSFGCDLSRFGSPPMPFVLWEGVPQVSDGYAVARDAIVHCLHRLVEELAPRDHPHPA